MVLSLALPLSGCATGGAPASSSPGTSAAAATAGAAPGAGAGAAPGTPTAPQVTEIALGAGDTIEVTVYRHDELRRNVKIDPSGKVMFPLIGDVQVVGRSQFALRDELEQRYARFIVSPHVSVSVTGIQSRKYVVLGEVRSPGFFQLDQELTAVDGIARAGGYSKDAKSQNVALIRTGKDGKPVVTSLNLRQPFAGNVALQSGDILYVPAAVVADVSWFMGHLSTILAPIVSLETAFVLWPQLIDAINGKSGQSSVPIIPVK